MPVPIGSKFGAFPYVGREIGGYKPSHSHRLRGDGDETLKCGPRRAEPFTEIVTGKAADDGRKADAQPKMGRCTNPGVSQRKDRKELCQKSARKADRNDGNERGHKRQKTMIVHCSG